MQELIADFQRMVKHYIKKIILFFLVSSMIYFAFGISNVLSYTKYNQKQVQKNVEEYQEVDMTHLCSVTGCDYVIAITPDEHVYNLYNRNNKILTLKDTKYDTSFLELSTDVFIDKDVNFYVFVQGLYIQVDTKEAEKNLFVYYFIMMIFLMPIFMSILYQSVKEEKQDAMTVLMNNEALLANKSMILITENIHHELNTPMEIIENKVFKLKDVIMPMINPEINGICPVLDKEEKEELYEDFELINQSAEQVYSVLERMRGFKHIRYSNGNKSIKDTLMGAFRVISISDSNFDFTVDAKLYGFRLRGKSLKNGDLLNIMLNHIKNSLEANATKIYITTEDFDNKYIYLRVVDDGNGISLPAQRKIFEPNFSTKDVAGDIRGNGLYLNKNILNSSSGDVKLIESSKYGTTFELKIPAERRPEEYMKDEEKE